MICMSRSASCAKLRIMFSWSSLCGSMCTSFCLPGIFLLTPVSLYGIQIWAGTCSGGSLMQHLMCSPCAAVIYLAQIQSTLRFTIHHPRSPWFCSLVQRWNLSINLNLQSLLLNFEIEVWDDCCENMCWCSFRAWGLGVYIFNSYRTTGVRKFTRWMMISQGCESWCRLWERERCCSSMVAFFRLTIASHIGKMYGALSVPTHSIWLSLSSSSPK